MLSKGYNRNYYEKMIKKLNRSEDSQKKIK